MTTSPNKPGVAEKIVRNLAVMQIGYEGHPFCEADAELFERLMHGPVFGCWIASTLNRRSQRHRQHFFYNEENNCLDFYVLTTPTETDGTAPESEGSNDGLTVRDHERSGRAREF